MVSTKAISDAPRFDRVALVLQGGGALGAYHIGAYQALEEAGFEVNFVAGISIGAINAALIAGSEPADRLRKLHEFWNLIVWPDFGQFVPMPAPIRQLYDLGSSTRALLFGQPGFFEPRLLNPYLAPRGAPGATSFYDTSPLRDTLVRLVDFDRINRGPVRLCLGAVKVTTGELTFFDSARPGTTIGPEHVMASGALPPGLPGVRVDGELYWDGGCVSNTPLDAVLEAEPRVDTLVFMIDLFDPCGPEPQALEEVLARQKDIQYASRSRHHLEQVRARTALQQLLARFPEARAAAPHLLGPQGSATETRVEIVHIIARAASYDLSSRDYEFSRLSIAERSAAGYQDLHRAIADMPWETLREAHLGARVHTFESVQDRPVGVSRTLGVPAPLLPVAAAMETALVGRQ
jgi:NTE family protein